MMVIDVNDGGGKFYLGSLCATYLGSLCAMYLHRVAWLICSPGLNFYHQASEFCCQYIFLEWSPSMYELIGLV